MLPMCQGTLRPRIRQISNLYARDNDSRILCNNEQLSISSGVTLIGPRTVSILFQFRGCGLARIIVHSRLYA
jgi:hypothetical protein